MSWIFLKNLLQNRLVHVCRAVDEIGGDREPRYHILLLCCRRLQKNSCSDFQFQPVLYIFSDICISVQQKLRNPVWFICPPQLITLRLTYAICYLLHVTCYRLHVTCNISLKFLQMFCRGSVLSNQNLDHDNLCQPVRIKMIAWDTQNIHILENRASVGK